MKHGTCVEGIHDGTTFKNCSLLIQNGALHFSSAFLYIDVLKLKVPQPNEDHFLIDLE